MAPQLSFPEEVLVVTTPRQYPIFRFGTGREGGWKTPSPGVPCQALRSTNKQATQGHGEFTQVQDARRLNSLLLHVWIEWIILVWLIEVVEGENPGGVG